MAGGEVDSRMDQGAQQAGQTEGGAKPPSRLLVVSHNMRCLATLPALLDDYRIVPATRWSLSRRRGEAVGVWGRKPSALRVMAPAQRAGLAVVAIEDGFLRSVGLGPDEPPLSVVVDDLGIYYDARSPSRLEQQIAQPLGDAAQARVRALIDAWRDAGVSKYNLAREPAALPEGDYVLVADQTRGDISIGAGLATAETFTRMLDAARAEHPDCTVVLRVHPDVMAGRKQGHFDLTAVARLPRVRVVADPSHPVAWIRAARAVYVATSQLGFEALMWGRSVRVFGMPFYAGWGLTQDALPAPARRGTASLAQLVHAALIAYPRYLDPETGRRCEVEDLVAWMAEQRRQRLRVPPALEASGFSGWKRQYAREFLAGARLRFVGRAMSPRTGVPRVSWGRSAASASDWQVEDGFLRSVGLGARGARPLSWVVDDLGMYYDATRPSRLERLLAEHAFDAALCTRAAALRARILAAGLTKYNLGGAAGEPPRPDRRGTGARVLLVPGQVEDDASIRYGATNIRRNMDLLRAVRERHPHDWIIYRPHPDVVARLRAAGQDEARAREWCDEVVADAPFQTLLGEVDAVHVLTSLAGFEALLRGREVVTYGAPFYAGWGLTQDVALPPSVAVRRQRRLTLDELVAGALLCYPTYVSIRSRRYTTPERALAELLAWRDGSLAPARAPRWRGVVDRLRGWTLW